MGCRSFFADLGKFLLGVSADLLIWTCFQYLI